MTETDIQRYAREVAAVDLDHERNQYTTTLEYRLAQEVVRLLEENEKLHQQSLTGCLEDRATIQRLRDANDRITEANNRKANILDRLREPSEAVVDAAFVAVIDWYPGAYNDRKSAEFSDEIISGLRAAVTAAEEEAAHHDPNTTPPHA